MRRLLFPAVAIAVLSVGLCAQQSGQAPAQAPGGRRGPEIVPKNLQVLPKDTTGAQVIQKMRYIAGSLGVRCNFCHVQGDFASDQKDTKQIARKMLRMVDSINKDNFDGREEVNCYTCHRGSTKPISQLPPEEGRGGRGGTR